MKLTSHFFKCSAQYIHFVVKQASRSLSPHRTEALSPLNSSSPPQPLSPWRPLPDCLYGSPCSRGFTREHTGWPFCAWPFRSAWFLRCSDYRHVRTPAPQGQTTLYSTRPLFISQWTFGWPLPLGHSEDSYYKHGSENISLRTCFEFFWIYTKKWDCWW